MGPLGLHGGGEFLPGDEPFLAALLAAARTPAEDRATSCGRAGPDEPLRVVVVPTAAAHQRPDAVAAHGIEAFERVAAGSTTDPAGSRRPIRVEVARVVDPASAASLVEVARLAAADLIHLPGGDPALIPSLLPGSAAWRAILAARARGAVLAGASAGAMALGPWTWTPTGVVPGLDLVPGILVMPHAGAASWADRAEWLAAAREAGVGVLGLAERTGVLGTAGSWRVVGPGEVRWLAPEAAEPLVLAAGATLALPG